MSDTFKVFGTFRQERIVGRAMPENKGSLRVLEKCGIACIGREVVDDHPAITYELLNPSIR